ncbi:response regulator transcription factor [Kutzneria sp. NPDC051319]|uniref:response regulator transcription factor n=1 Tax=Kutzneria sp. NPDC051319 TaxID=3155047 RepID=UPI00343D65DA
MTARILVVDDQTLVRGSFRVLLETTSDLVVVGEAGNGREAVDLVAALAPDVVLMDVRMPEMDGIEATRRITETSAARVLVLTTYDLDEYVYGALRVGASGFVLKDTPPADLIAAVRVVAAGEALLAPSVTQRLIRAFVSVPETAPASLDGITAREREILLLVARGLSNAEISQRLHVGVTTTKTHVSRLLTKLGARDRAQLVIAAYESGLIRPAR